MKPTLAILLFLAAIALPSAFATDMYVDYVGGSDTNDGHSVSSPWQHIPRDGRASGVATNHAVVAGDVVYFKRGVTYDFTGNANLGLRPASSGSLIVTRNTGSISALGVLSDATANFGASNVLSSDYLYVYNSSTNGLWIESCGYWQITNVTATTLSVRGFGDAPYEDGDLSYLVIRPITYTSTNTWGTGPAVLSGGGAVDALMRPLNYTRFANLDMRDMHDVVAGGCTNEIGGCIFDNNDRNGIIVDGINFSNVWSAFRVPGNYSIMQGCTVTNFGYFGVVPGDYSLVQSNITQTGCRSVGNMGSYCVVRFNTFLDNTNCGCDEHSNGIGVVFGGSLYGWIYGNWIENAVQGIYLTVTSGGTRGFTIANNVVVGHVGDGKVGVGTTGIGVSGGPDTRIYNNTIAGTNNQLGWIKAVSVGSLDDHESNIDSTNVWFFNNIICNAGASADGLLHIYTTNISDTFHAEGNMFYSPQITDTDGLTVVTSVTYAAYQALGFDNAGRSFHNVNPLFVDSANQNFRLQSGSPALASPYTLSIALPDAAGTIRPLGTFWDRGAYQTLTLTVPRPYPSRVTPPREFRPRQFPARPR